MLLVGEPALVTEWPVRPEHVFIVTYGCFPTDNTEPVLSYEHKEIGLFAECEVPTLVMPDGYKRSIATWYAMLRENPELTR